MKYWIFQSNQVLGPYGPEDLSGLGTFSAESLVCPEGRRGTSMGDWTRAGMLPDLSGALLKAAQNSPAKVPVLTLAGLPAEPTLKDLAVLGSLQEKTAMLEDAVLQLQESLRVKDAELSALHQELADKDKEAFELKRSVEERKTETEVIKADSETLKNETEVGRKRAEELAAETELRRIEAEQLKAESERLKAESEELKSRLAEMEERVGEVRRIGDALDKAVEAEKKVEHDVDAHGATLGDLARQIEDLRAQLHDKLSVAAQIMPSAEAPARPPSIPAPDPAPVPAPFAFSAPAPAAAPVPIASANIHFTPAPSSAPSPAPVPAPLPEMPNIAPPPAAAAPAPGFGGAAPEGSPFGSIAPLPAFGGPAAPDFGAPPPASGPDALAKPAFDPLTPLEPVAAAAPEPAPEPAKPAAPPKKRKSLLAVAGLVAVALVVVVLYAGRGRRAAPPSAEQAEPAPVAATPLAPAKNAAPMPPVAPGGSAEGGPVDGAVGSPVAVDPHQVAIDAARNWKLDDGRTLGDALETLSPPTGNLSPWMAEPQPSGIVLVNYFAHGAPGAPTVAYEFEVGMDGKTVAARNAAAKAVLTGKAIEPPAPPTRPAHVKVKPKHKTAAKAKPAAAPTESLDNLLGAPGDGASAAAPGDSAAAAGAPTDAQETPAPAAPKPAAKPAAGSPAPKQDSLDDLLKE